MDRPNKSKLSVQEKDKRSGQSTFLKSKKSSLQDIKWKFEKEILKSINIYQDDEGNNSYIDLFLRRNLNKKIKKILKKNSSIKGIK